LLEPATIIYYVETGLKSVSTTNFCQKGIPSNKPTSYTSEITLIPSFLILVSSAWVVEPMVFVVVKAWATAGYMMAKAMAY
jgi:hypothetical protein